MTTPTLGPSLLSAVTYLTQLSSKIITVVNDWCFFFSSSFYSSLSNDFIGLKLTFILRIQHYTISDVLPSILDTSVLCVICPFHHPFFNELSMIFPLLHYQFIYFFLCAVCMSIHHFCLINYTCYDIQDALLTRSKQ